MPPAVPNPAVVLLHQRLAYATSLIQSLAVGLYLVVAVQSIVLQLRRKSGNRSFFLAYTCTMLGVVVTWYTLAVVTDEKNQIQKENTACLPIGITRQVFGTLILWAADTLLIWRLFVVWDGNKLVCAFPLTIFLASLGTGFALNLTCLSSQSSANIKLLSASRLSAPFIACSIGLNVTGTALIVFRLLAPRRQAKRAGIPTSSAVYTSLAGILVESSAIYTTGGILFLPFLITGAPLGQVFSVVFIAGAFLAPALIQLRVAQGAAYMGSRTGSTPRTTASVSRGTDDTAFSVQLDSVSPKTAPDGSWPRSPMPPPQQMRDPELWRQK